VVHAISSAVCWLSPLFYYPHGLEYDVLNYQNMSHKFGQMSGAESANGPSLKYLTLGGVRKIMALEQLRVETHHFLVALN